MIVCCSVNAKHLWRGDAYCTTVVPMGKLPRLAFLAPTKEMVWGVKYYGWSHERYDDAYRALLARRWSEVKLWLDSLRVETDYTLLCYCREGAGCHRALIARMLAKWRPDLAVMLR